MTCTGKRNIWGREKWLGAQKINMTIDMFSLRKLVEFPSKNVPGNLGNTEAEFRQEGDVWKSPLRMTEENME